MQQEWVRPASLQLVEKVEIGESILLLNSFSQITHGLLLFISTVICYILHRFQSYISIHAIYPNNLYCHMVHTWDCVFKSDVCLLPHHLIGRGNVRTRRVWTSSPLDRARMLLTPPTFKERLSVDSPFNYLTISHNDIKRLIADEKKVEKVLKMSFLPCTLRWIIMLHCHNVKKCQFCTF